MEGQRRAEAWQWGRASQEGKSGPHLMALYGEGFGHSTLQVTRGLDRLTVSMIQRVFKEELIPGP